MSIFISIASYRDPALVQTIESAISNANNPDNLHFGVVIQDIQKDTPDLSKYKNIKLITMHPRDARGAGFARDKAVSLLEDQQYFLQIDSHTIFEKGWDDIAINELAKAKNIAKNNKVLLSYFPPPFYIEQNKAISIIKNDKKQLPYPTRQKPILNKKGEWTAERIEFADKQRNSPEESSTVLGGFIFADADLVKQVPYDPDISFFGEEICFAMRAWTRGWDIYSPSKTIVYHFYFRNNYKKIWKDINVRKISWSEIEDISKEKQKRVLCGIEQGIYGYGKDRSLEEFELFTGLNFKKHYGLTN